MNTLKADICEIMDSFSHLDAIDKMITIAQLPETIKRQGRRYSRIFFSRCVQLSVHLDKVGHFLVDFLPGWNPFDFPDGTEIALLEGQEPITALHHLYD